MRKIENHVVCGKLLKVERSLRFSFLLVIASVMLVARLVAEGERCGVIVRVVKVWTGLEM